MLELCWLDKEGRIIFRRHSPEQCAELACVVLHQRVCPCERPAACAQPITPMNRKALTDS
jgi:hypothetical protein